MDKEKLLNKIDSFKDELIKMRRHIHAHPELSGQENLRRHQKNFLTMIPTYLSLRTAKNL